LGPTLKDCTMERAVLVYTTWPSIVEAEAAGRKIVERRLAACVNILPRVLPISQLLGGSLQRRRCGGGHSDALFASSRGADI
jgi:CutA1 divalent ion tolerance protein